MSDGYEPHGQIECGLAPVPTADRGCRGRGVPGVVGTVGGGREGYTGTHPAPSQMTIFSHIPGRKAYPRPNEGKSEVIL